MVSKIMKCQCGDTPYHRKFPKAHVVSCGWCDASTDSQRHLYLAINQWNRMQVRTQKPSQIGRTDRPVEVTL